MLISTLAGSNRVEVPSQARTAATSDRADGAAATADRSAEVLRLLADPVRWRILVLLAQEQLCSCHLQAELDAKQTLVAHHLRALREGGLVEASRAGRYTYYRLVPGALIDVARQVGMLAVAPGGDVPRRPC